VTVSEDIQEVRLGLSMLAGSTGYEYEDDREQAEKSLAALERLETRLLAAEHALREIMAVPSARTLLTNAEARAMYEYASRALAAAPSGPPINRHPLHHCLTCGTEDAPGAGCGNCRQTGFDQTPCLHADCQGSLTSSVETAE
jgi:hypothetical protein